MKKSRINVSVLFITILVLGGLGLGSYFLIASQGTDSEVLMSIGRWNILEKNTKNNPEHNRDHNFLVGWSDPFEINASYVNLTNRTQFNLLKTGLYKISLTVSFSKIYGAATYSMALLINSNIVKYIDRFAFAYGFSINYTSYTSFYLLNEDSNLQFEVFAISETEDPFTVDITNEDNQLVIEYVIQ